MVGHVDDQLGCGKSELYVPVAQPHHQPGGQAGVAEWFGEAPANQKSALTAADRRTSNHCDIYHADDEEFFDQIEYWKTPVSDCGDDRGEECKTYDEWVQGWNEVKG